MRFRTAIAAAAGSTLATVLRVALDRPALSATAGTWPVYLMETRREGWFVWNSANLSAQVAADTRQGLYVAPSSDTTGASGAWVRTVSSGILNIQWFGGIADAIAAGTGTNNTPALDCAAAIGGLLGRSVEILFPAALGHYRFSTQPADFTNTVKIVGQGHGENPGTVNGVSFPNPQNYRGTVLRFDADVKGFTFSSAAGTSNANAQVYTYQGSSRSIVRDIMLLGGGGTRTDAHGVDCYVIVNFTNVRVCKFAGNGVNLAANTAGALRYGNTDMAQFYGCKFDQNKLHGAYLDGNDDNVCNFIGVSFSDNGGCGSLDTTPIGNNLFEACHYTNNNRSHPTNSASGWTAAQIAKAQADAPCLTDYMAGSAVQYRSKIYNNTDIGNSSAYICCYVEGGTGSLARLKSPTHVAGGLLPQVANRHSEWSAQTANGPELLNVVKFQNINQGSFMFYDAPLTVTRTSATDATNPVIKVTPTQGTFSSLTLQGQAGSTALGLDITAGNLSAYFSADTLNWRNAAQTTNYATLGSTGFVVKVGTIGYATGTGSAVTQLTSRTTSVTANTGCGQITLFSAAGSATFTTMTVNNSKVAATDTIRVCQASGADKYMTHVTAVRAGSFDITYATTGGTTVEQPVFNFSVLKGVIA